VRKFDEIIAFLRNLYNNPDGFVPLHAPIFIGNERKYLGECIDTTYVSSVGRFVDRFEEETASYTGAAAAVVCLNGTNALHLALMLGGVKRNDEVITQPLTFIATANAISYCGAHPVFIDIDKETLGLSAEALSEFLETQTEFIANACYNKYSKRRISACVPMHTYGHPCRIDKIVDICSKHKIVVIEDAAESMGSLYKDIHTGLFGEIGVLSFNGNKIITTGGGGMLLLKDKALAKYAKHLSTQAKVPHQWEFVHDEIGYNYRMPNINAALGLAQLEKLEDYIKIKRSIAERYRHFFATIDIRFFAEPSDSRSNYWLNCILLNDKKERDLFLKYTNDNNVMTRPAWELMNNLPMFRNAQCGSLSNAEWISNRLVNIPSSVIPPK
jgi:aminotransferase in exopolysaccharide biosynthesis